MDIMDLLFFLAVGLTAGFAADLVVKNKFGLIGDLVIGVVGSFIGYLVLDQFGITMHDNFISQFISAFIGAVLLLIVINIFTREKKK